MGDPVNYTDPSGLDPSDNMDPECGLDGVDCGDSGGGGDGGVGVPPFGCSIFDGCIPGDICVDSNSFGPGSGPIMCYPPVLPPRQQQAPSNPPCWSNLYNIAETLADLAANIEEIAATQNWWFPVGFTG